MAICGSCNSESRRVRSRWTDKGVQLPDECPNCKPQSFEKLQMPSDKKMWMGYEYMPNMYKRTENGWEAKDELRQDTEDQVCRESSDDKEAYQRAVAKKRAWNPPPLEAGSVRLRHVKERADKMVRELRGELVN